MKSEGVQRLPSDVIRGVTCPWCKHFWRVVPSDPSCARCGGVLPAPPGPTRGPAPSSAPRTLPDAYVRSLLVWNSNMGMLGVAWGAFGVLFLVLGVPLTFVLLPVGCIFAVFGAIVGTVGVLVYRRSRRAPLRQIAALRTGVGVEGEIVDVRRSAQSMNGVSAWDIEYAYRVEGRTARGMTTGWDIAHSIRQKGEPIWVVYLADDPEACSVWPPMS